MRDNSTPTNPTLVIYHANCVDGFTAAWIANRFYAFVEFLSVAYGDTPPPVEGRDVLIVDFSYPRATLLQMHSVAKSLQVLDHHKTAEKDLEDLGFCIFDMQRSGAGLTWDTLFPAQPRPILVDYVEDRDLWRFRLPESRSVNALIFTADRTWSAFTHLNKRLMRNFDNCVGEGKACDAVVARSVDEQIRHASTVRFCGHIVPMLNTTFASSEALNTLAVKATFAIGWRMSSDRSFHYSLRSVGQFDVSEIAKIFGGGGHRNAAGFKLDRLI